MNRQHSLLNRNDVHVWFRQTRSISDAEEQMANRYLSSEECKRRDRLVFQLDRRDYSVSHDLLRRKLSIHGAISPADWTFQTNPWGKPSLAGKSSLSFSLSHTRGFVACAIGITAAIGVDVETIRQNISYLDLAKQYFAKSEVESLRSCSPEEGPVLFTELWTLKEAYLKAKGVGISGGLDSITFECNQGKVTPHKFSKSDPGATWMSIFSPVDGMRMAIASLCVEPPRISVYEDYGDS